MTLIQEPTIEQIIAGAGASTAAALNRIGALRKRMPVRHRRRGTGTEYMQLRATAAREFCELQDRSGSASWLDVLEHRLREFGATSSTDRDKLVERLEMLAATAVAAIEDIEVSG